MHSPIHPPAAPLTQQFNHPHLKFTSQSNTNINTLSKKHQSQHNHHYHHPYQIQPQQQHQQSQQQQQGILGLTHRRQYRRKEHSNSIGSLNFLTQSDQSSILMDSPLYEKNSKMNNNNNNNSLMSNFNSVQPNILTNTPSTQLKGTVLNLDESRKHAKLFFTTNNASDSAGQIATDRSTFNLTSLHLLKSTSTQSRTSRPNILAGAMNNHNNNNNNSASMITSNLQSTLKNSASGSIWSRQISAISGHGLAKKSFYHHSNIFNVKHYGTLPTESATAEDELAVITSENALPQSSIYLDQDQQQQQHYEVKRVLVQQFRRKLQQYLKMDRNHSNNTPRESSRNSPNRLAMMMMSTLNQNSFASTRKVTDKQSQQQSSKQQYSQYHHQSTTTSSPKQLATEGNLALATTTLPTQSDEHAELMNRSLDTSRFCYIKLSKAEANLINSQSIDVYFEDKSGKQHHTTRKFDHSVFQDRFLDTIIQRTLKRYPQHAEYQDKLTFYSEEYEKVLTRIQEQPFRINVPYHYEPMMQPFNDFYSIDPSKKREKNPVVTWEQSLDESILSQAVGLIAVTDACDSNEPAINVQNNEEHLQNVRSAPRNSLEHLDLNRTGNNNQSIPQISMDKLANSAQYLEETDRSTLSPESKKHPHHKHKREKLPRQPKPKVQQQQEQTETEPSEPQLPPPTPYRETPIQYNNRRYIPPATPATRTEPSQRTINTSRPRNTPREQTDRRAIDEYAFQNIPISPRSRRNRTENSTDSTPNTASFRKEQTPNAFRSAIPAASDSIPQIEDENDHPEEQNDNKSQQIGATPKQQGFQQSSSSKDPQKLSDESIEGPREVSGTPKPGNLEISVTSSSGDHRPSISNELKTEPKSRQSISEPTETNTVVDSGQLVSGSVSTRANNPNIPPLPTTSTPSENKITAEVFPELVNYAGDDYSKRKIGTGLFDELVKLTSLLEFDVVEFKGERKVPALPRDLTFEAEEDKVLFKSIFTWQHEVDQDIEVMADKLKVHKSTAAGAGKGISHISESSENDSDEDGEGMGWEKQSIHSSDITDFGDPEPYRESIINMPSEDFSDLE